ncbi:hypothetical protein Cgig2_033952 [Carnegiea gigantea]|uniref:GRAM domain-containing protein n=1 Tax=Carnegiea gigantea TaxID=171969 RepID=A0A9Q1KE80_9CARY|nr:hypothetical protein Cgig2_033952 [Carnegiea gigantea]
MEYNNIQEKQRSWIICFGDHLLRNGLPRITYNIQTEKTTQPMKLLSGPSDVSCTWRQHKVGSVFNTTTKFVRGRLRLGAKLVQAGGIDKLFRQILSVREGERLLKAFQCTLSTTAGPITGRLFISTEKIAFCSDRAIAKFSFRYWGNSEIPLQGNHVDNILAYNLEIIDVKFNVAIPLSKIKRANEMENVKRPSQKYLQVVTKDGFEFWFMGFINYRKTLNCMQQAAASKLG